MASDVQHLQQELSGALPNVSVRGSGAASFVFAELGGRAIEASVDNGNWWIEFWDVSDDEDAAPVREATIEQDDKALLAITDWLLKSRADGTRV